MTTIDNLTAEIHRLHGLIADFGHLRVDDPVRVAFYEGASAYLKRVKVRCLQEELAKAREQVAYLERVLQDSVQAWKA